MTDFDYIIVGGGSAGGVLADRLTENGRHRVLLLEAGGEDDRFFVRMPIGYGKIFFDPTLNWMYRSEEDSGTGGRSSYWPRGKILGGSSSINAMVYIRGQRTDFDDWAAAGNPGWGWSDVLPYFRKMERYAGGDDELHGRDGPLTVSDASADMHPLCDVYLAACREIGIPVVDDLNGAEAECAGLYHLTTRDGRRESTATAYIRPARRRANLAVETGALATRVLFDGLRAVGVEYRKGGDLLTVRCAGEVILAAGAVNSPQLLQLSGVGPASLLVGHGISITRASDAVGRNLQDHLGADYLYRSRRPTLNQQLRPWWGKLWHGARYVLTRRGPLSLSVNQGGGFVRGREGLERPNLQLYFSPVSYIRAPAGKRPLMSPDPYPGFLLGWSACRPKSRGHIEITGPDPTRPPRIVPCYLTAEEDVEDMLDGARLMRRLAATAAMRALVEEELKPGATVQSREAMIADIRARASTVFHPTSTCRMGPDPDTSVVDARLRVHGLERLRVIDASIFPNVTSGNTNAPAIMVGEKGADLVLADAPG